MNKLDSIKLTFNIELERVNNVMSVIEWHSFAYPANLRILCRDGEKVGIMLWRRGREWLLENVFWI